MTDKTDFKRTLDVYRARRGRFRIVEVPSMQYLMTDGHGDPNGSSTFTEAVESLYPVAYTLKFASKRNLGHDYVVPPLEGLWWAEDKTSFTTSRDKSAWDWTMMIMTPDWIDHDMFTAAVEHVRSKKRLPRPDAIRLETLSEKLSAQTLHVGSFDDEAGTLAELHHEFIPRHQLRMVGKHHEIYLSDFRKVAPERQRTILRQPVTTTATPDT